MDEVNRIETYRALLDRAANAVDSWPEPSSTPPVAAEESGWTAWTQQDPVWMLGCAAGYLWQVSIGLGEARWHDRAAAFAEAMEAALANRPPLGTTAALWLSHVPWYRLTRDGALVNRLTPFAQAQAACYAGRAKFLRGAANEATIKLESLLDVPLLFLVAHETLEQDLGRRAMAHARTTIAQLLSDPKRPLAAADYNSGNYRFSPQPIDDGLALARMAWAMYGYAQIHAVSDIREMLNTAEDLAMAWIVKLPASRIPDRATASGSRPDLLAGCQAVVALLQLARQTSVEAHALTYRTTALATLDAIVEQQVPRAGGQGLPSLLPRDGSGRASMAAEFFLVEALVAAVAD